MNLDTTLDGYTPAPNEHIAPQMTRRADHPRRKACVEPRAAAQVEHRLAGLQRGDGLRIAASETEVRAFGDCARFFHRVAQLLGYRPN